MYYMVTDIKIDMMLYFYAKLLYISMVCYNQYHLKMDNRHQEISKYLKKFTHLHEKQNFLNNFKYTNFLTFLLIDL